MHLFRALELYHSRDYVQGIQVAIEASQFYQDSNDLPEWSECQNLAGLCHLALGHPSEANFHLDEALRVYGLMPDSEEVRIWRGKANYHKGMAYQQAYNPGAARDSYRQAEGLLASIGSARAFAAACAQNLGVVCNELYAMQEAVEAGERSVRGYQALIDLGQWEHLPDLARSWTNLAMALYCSQQARQAVTAGLRAQALLRTLVEEWGRRDLEHTLYAISSNLRNMNSPVPGPDGQAEEARRLVDEGLVSQAVELLDRLVFEDRRYELAGLLFRALRAIGQGRPHLVGYPRS